MSDPLVSVIMPAYNAAKHVRESIDSVISQTYTNWELIIVDDGSTDSTAEVVKKAAADDKRVRYVYQENGRQGKARNNGIRHATGEYIAFLDADDLWVPEKLKIQVGLLQEKKVDVTYSDSWYFIDKPEHKNVMKVVPGLFQGEKDFPHFLEVNRVPILTVVATKKAVDGVNGFSEEREIQNAEDLNMWLKLLLAGNSFLAIDTPLTHYRLNPESSTATDRHVIFPVLQGIRKIARLWPQYKPVIARSFLTRIDNYLRQNNIGKWEMIERLLMLRNRITDKKISTGFWKMVYSIAGKRGFRILFKSALNTHNEKVVNNNIEELQF